MNKYFEVNILKTVLAFLQVSSIETVAWLAYKT